MSTPVSTAVDALGLVLEYLRGDGPTTAIADDRIADELPHAPQTPTFPYLTASRLPSPAKAFPPWLDRVRLQIDAWDATEEQGGSQRRAFKLAAAAEAALLGLHGALTATLDGEDVAGVVAGVEETVAPFYLPDPVTSRPRVLFEVLVHIHP